MRCKSSVTEPGEWYNLRTFDWGRRSTRRDLFAVIKAQATLTNARIDFSVQANEYARSDKSMSPKIVFARKYFTASRKCLFAFRLCPMRVSRSSIRPARQHFCRIAKRGRLPIWSRDNEPSEGQEKLVSSSVFAFSKSKSLSFSRREGNKSNAHPAVGDRVKRHFPLSKTELHRGAIEGGERLQGNDEWSMI